MSQNNLVNAPHPTSGRSISIYSHHLCLGLPSGLLPLGLPTKILYAPLLFLMPRPSHSSLFDHPNIRWVQIIKCPIMLSSPLPITSSLVGPNIFLRTLFPNTLSLCSLLTVGDHVPHSYKTNGKIIVLYIWTFIFLDSKQEDKKFCTKQ